ncbi:MAG: hypothetical protein KIS76_03960 [Pyrinomonadaceae bacterium]|nr:hypothetical protein [Pyrinomonadaceae bacterium]
MKNSDLVKLRQEIAMLEAKIETIFFIVSKITEIPDAEADRRIDLWADHTIDYFLELLEQRGLPFRDLYSPPDGAEDGEPSPGGSGLKLV